MLAGPIGSGKATFYETRIAPKFSVTFINVDIILHDELKSSDVNAAYKAAQIDTERRASLMADRKSFATETVFSHPSKLDLNTQAKALGNRVMTFHIAVAHPDLSVARVGERVIQGGHTVPEEKIRNRYERSGPLIRQAILASDIGHVFYNSQLNHAPVRAVSFTNGTPTFVLPQLTNWGLNLYRDYFVL